jgi:hypothetical protein
MEMPQMDRKDMKAYEMLIVAMDIHIIIHLNDPQKAVDGILQLLEGALPIAEKERRMNLYEMVNAYITVIHKSRELKMPEKEIIRRLIGVNKLAVETIEARMNALPPEHPPEIYQVIEALGLDPSQVQIINMDDLPQQKGSGNETLH